MKKQLLKLKRLVVRPVPLSVGLFIGIALLLFYKILTLVPFGLREYASEIGVLSVNQIKLHILFAPIKTVQFAILKFGDNDVQMRFASALAGLIAAYFLYLMLRKWYTARVSLLTTLMFGTSTWFLQTSRHAGSDVLYLSVVPVLLLSCLWFLSKKHDAKLPIVAFLLGLLLYVPGAVVLIISALILFRKYLWKTVPKLSKRIKYTSLAVFVGTITPLIYSFSLRQRQILEWIGFDESQTWSAQTLASNLIEIPRQLFVSGPNDPAIWLFGTPVLDIFSIVMFCLGIYAFRAGYYPAREKLVFLFLGILIGIIWLGNVASLSLIMPLIYIFIANGLAYMLQSWFTVFPRNPLARGIGVSIIVVVVLLSCSYQLQRYFVAWPKAEQTVPALINNR